tara:strand:+ start:921 stop:1364 length:444 start_codon:yes stop_codon:yes gene_type:complete
MAVGSILRDRDVQYIALRDETSKTWRILDTWHEDLKGLDLEDDIPDDNAAVQVLTESGFTALIKEAARLGVLENVNFGMDTSYEIEEKDAEIAKLKDENSKIREETKNKKEEPYKGMSEEAIIKLKAMEYNLKITSAITDFDNLTKE